MMVDILKRPFNFFDNKVIGKKLLVKNLISLDAIGKELDTLTIRLTFNMMIEKIYFK